MKYDLTNFLKISLENAYGISLRKRVYTRDFAYIITTCEFIFQLYRENENDEEIEKMYHRAIVLFSRTLEKIGN